MAQSEFVRQLDQARASMSEGRWSSARRRLEAALEGHRGRSYVFAHRRALDEDLCRCAFGSSWEPAPWSELIEAELQHYRPSTGSIHLVDGPLSGDLVEWERSSTDWAWEWAAGAVPAWRSAPRVWVHPARVSGDVVLRLRGSDFRPGTAILFDLRDVDEMRAVLFGRSEDSPSEVSVSIVEVRGAQVRRLAEATSPRLRRGEPFSLEVQVDGRRLRVRANAEVVLDAEVEVVPGGHTGFEGGGPDCEFELEGRIERAWLEGRQDTRRLEAWHEFQQNWRQNPALPLWLRSGWADPRRRMHRLRATTDAPSFVPGPPEVASHATVETVFRLHAADRHEQALSLLDQAPARSLPEETVCYLKALSYEALERYESALRFASRASVLSPSFQRSRELEASLYDALHRPDLARVIYRGLLENNPGSSSVYEDYAWFLLSEGDRGEAGRVLAAAESGGIESASLARARRIVEKARRGPMWPRSWRHRTAHYEVVSDIDRATCVAAASQLERALGHYQRHIRPLPPRAEPFLVYVFSGERGYLDYCRDLAIDLPMVTAGVYSRTLEQLLVWNLPDRASMLRTIRHEGFHQYVAALGGDAPRWFDEGLAEYYEHAVEVGNRMLPGELDAEQLRPLARDRIALSRFLRLDHEEFLRRAGLHYAQAWAFIHFLHHSEPEGPDLIQSMFSALAAGQPASVAVEGVFAQVDLDAMDDRFAVFLDQALGR